MQKKKPKIFIGSSSEALPAGRALCINLEHHAEISLWSDNVFGLSQATITNILNILDKSDFGIFILSPDDSTKVRGRTYLSPRDNVLLEIGLFAGRLGIERTFIVHPRNSKLKIPTDLLGIACATYEPHSSGNWSTTLNAASAKIINEIELRRQLNVRTDVSWEEMCSLVTRAGDSLRSSPHNGGFMPDIIIGISRGGMILADLLSRYLGGRIPTVNLWADRYAKFGASFFGGAFDCSREYIEKLLQAGQFRNVLIVDDISRTGNTLHQAVKFLKSIKYPHEIRSLLFFKHKNSLFSADYTICETSDSSLVLPFSSLG